MQIKLIKQDRIITRAYNDFEIEIDGVIIKGTKWFYNNDDMDYDSGIDYSDGGYIKSLNDDEQDELNDFIDDNIELS